MGGRDNIMMVTSLESVPFATLYFAGVFFMKHRLGVDWSYRNLIIKWILVPVPVYLIINEVQYFAAVPYILKAVLASAIALILNYLYWDIKDS